MTVITDKEIREKIMKEKTLEMEKAIEQIKQNTFEKKNQKNTIQEALITTKEKQLIQKETIQRMEKFGARPKTKFTGTRLCIFCNNPNWNLLHENRHRSRIVTTAEKRDTMQGHDGKDKTTTEQ